MTEPKQPMAGGDGDAGALDAQLEAGDSVMDSDPLPAGILDDAPLEAFDEQGFLSAISEEDERPRFGAAAAVEEETGAAEMLSTDGIESTVMDAVAALDADAALPDELSGMQIETETDASPLNADGESEGLDLGLDEIDLAAIEELAEEIAPPALASPGPSLDFDSDDKRKLAAAAAAPKLPKFMFDVSFDLPDRHEDEKSHAEPEPTPEPEPEVPPPPTFSEEELAAARQAGYADGQTAGYQEAMQSLESRISQGVDAVGMYLPSLLSERERLATALAQDAARLAHALVRRALPELNRRFGTAEIEAVVRDSIQLALDQPRILIRVAPDIAERLTGPIDAASLANGFSGKVSVIGDPSLGPADVRLDWGDGGVERMAERVWADLTTIVAHMVEGLEAETKLDSVTIGSAA